MDEFCEYKVVWPDGSLELHTRAAAVHLAKAFRETGRVADIYSRPDRQTEWALSE